MAGLLLLLIPDDMLPLPAVLGADFVIAFAGEGACADFELWGAAEGGEGESEDGGANIILRTSSSDINAASIPAQSMPALLLLLLLLLLDSRLPTEEPTLA